MTPTAAQIPEVQSHRLTPEIEGSLSRVIWMASDDDPLEQSALLTARQCNRIMTQPHMVWNPLTGDLVQMIPRGRKNRMYPPSTPASDCYCVLVVCKAGERVIPMDGSELTSILESLDIPPVWPAGPPYSGSPHVTPLNPGHYSANQISATHKGVGSIDIHQLGVT